MTSPIWAGLLAFIILGEKYQRLDMMAAIMGFIGAIFIVIFLCKFNYFYKMVIIYLKFIILIIITNFSFAILKFKI